MNWKVIEVEPLEWIQDVSGYYTLINFIEYNIIRLDFMAPGDVPAISFQGIASDVRKAFARYTEANGMMLSAEHMAYIGYEIARAELMQGLYIQD